LEVSLESLARILIARDRPQPILFEHVGESLDRVPRVEWPPLPLIDHAIEKQPARFVPVRDASVASSFEPPDMSTKAK